MKSCLKMVASAATLLLWGCSQSPGISVGTIKTAAELKTKMEETPNLKVVHALDAENYAEGHVPGAINIDYEKMLPDMLPKDKSRPMVFYCTGGMCPVGKMAADKAASWGYTRVWVYKGGLQDWKSAGMKLAKGG